MKVNFLYVINSGSMIYVNIETASNYKSHILTIQSLRVNKVLIRCPVSRHIFTKMEKMIRVLVNDFISFFLTNLLNC